MFILPTCPQDCPVPLSSSFFPQNNTLSYISPSTINYDHYGKIPQYCHSTCDQRPFHETVHSYKTQLLTNPPMCWPVWPLALWTTVIDTSAPERMRPRNRCSYTSKVNGGLLGKGTDIPAPGKKDHRVRKVGRGMTAAATNLGTMFGTGGRREWERNFSLGLQWHLSLCLELTFYIPYRNKKTAGVCGCPVITGVAWPQPPQTDTVLPLKCSKEER